MNPTLLKDLILAGHRVACKTTEGEWKVFMFVNGDGKFQGTNVEDTIESCLFTGLRHTIYDDWGLGEYFTGEYKIVTPLPQLPQVGDTVEVLEICKELPGFDEWSDERKDMVGREFIVEGVSMFGDIKLEGYQYTSRQVAKCELDVEPTPVGEEKFGEIIELNGKKYREII